ncbi:DUF6479 family protein [Streptomyces sp. NPDC088197]|uniref:DUF6479 family protein n=1 Tax=Streptomyces sp. NPDC088197 TaxID=3365840 RepID=UPI003828C34C
MTSTHYLASSGVSGSLLILLAAIVVAAVLLGGFWYGSRRMRSRRTAAPAVRPDPAGPNGQPDPAASADAQRGRTWQTIDDDPEQGAPHRQTR